MSAAASLSLTALEQQLKELGRLAERPWREAEIRAARQAWDCYDRVRLQLLRPVEVHFAAYQALRVGMQGSGASSAEVCASLGEVTAAAERLDPILESTARDLYDAAEPLADESHAAVEGRRSALARLRGDLAVWGAKLRVEGAEALGSGD